MSKHIGFNTPHLTGKEVHYIYDAVFNKQLSGNGKYTKLCHDFFQKKYGFNRVLLTTSCTDALEMCALLIGIKPGDEVIMPSYTFVSTANAFVLRGASIVFADSYSHHPNINADRLEELINPRTKAIVIMHYGGVACDMEKIKELAGKYNLYLIEDAAQAINSYYVKDQKKVPLGSIGDLATLSFHETKNIISGEGGLLIINNSQFIGRAEIIWEKGTNRAAFFRGEVDKYNWVDIGSSFLPSELIAAFLYAQLEHIDDIQQKRLQLWNRYHNELKVLEEKNYVSLPSIPSYATNNAHIYYLVCKNKEERTALIQYLKQKNIQVLFHYISLHSSPFYKNKHNSRVLPNADRFSDCLVRLPMFYSLTSDDQSFIIEQIKAFYEKYS